MAPAARSLLAVDSPLPAGGRRLTTGTGCVSGDGRFILLPAGATVRVCGAATGDTVSSLSGAHTSQVTAVVSDPIGAAQVYSASLDGTVKLWDLTDGQVLKTVIVGAPVVSLVVPSKGNVAFVTCDWREGTSGRVYRLDLKSGRPLEANMRVTKPGRLAASTNGALVATVDKHTLFVWKTHQAQMEPLALHHTKRFTCCALAPNGGTVAAGDVSGRITMWHDLEAAMLDGAYSEAKTSVSTVHWHSAAVGSICFSADGNYLLSGGLEAVLVIWQLASGKRSYLPRLGGALMSISSAPDPACYLVAQSDNTVRLINISTLQVNASVYGMLPPPHSASPQEATGPALLQPGTGHLVLPAENAMLQFYDVVHDRHVERLQVAPRNSVSLTTLKEEAGMDGAGGLPEEPRVARLAFSASGDWLVTAEVRPSLGTGRSVEWSLKFWERTSESQGRAGSRRRYVLNTQADVPHESDLTCLAYHPVKHIAVTGSASGQFKVWARHSAPKTPNNPVSASSSEWAWRCRSAGDTADTASSLGGAISAAAFSHDGSLLAMACGSRVSLWEPETNAQIAQLPAPSAGKSSLRHLAFIHGTSFLVGAASGGGSGGLLVVWNLLTASVWWSYRLPVSVLAADQRSARFAVAVHSPAGADSAAPAGDATRGGFVLLFDPVAAAPVAAWRLKPASSAPAALLFAPPGSDLAARFDGTSGAGPLLLINQTREFTVLGCPSTAAAASEWDATAAAAAPEFVLEGVFGAVPAASALAPSASSGAASGAASKSVPDLFDAPSHALPSVAELCPAFLEMIVSGLDARR